MPIARSPEELPRMDEVLSLSGLDVMRRVLEGDYSAAPISEGMTFAMTAVDDGRVVFRGTPSFAMTNPTGSVHGGWYGTLLDSAMACAVMTKVPAGSTYTTLEYKVNIVRAIPVGMEVECVGTVDHAGRSTGVAHGEIRGVEDGRLYATGSTTCIIMKLR